MKHNAKLAAVLVLLVTFSALAIVRHRNAPFAQQPQQQIDERRQKIQNLKVDDFHGDAASLRVRQLRRLSKGVARAMREAENRGLRGAFEHSRVILGTELPSQHKQSTRWNSSTIRPSSRGTAKFAHRQQSFTDGEYEVTFIPYDDGDPATWEGIIYRYTPDWGDDIRYAVLNIDAAEPDVTQEIYYPPDGSDPQPLDPNDPAPIISSGRVRTCKPIAALSHEAKGTASLPGLPPCPPGWRRCLRSYDECCSPPPDLKPWLTCSSKGCAGAALACGRTGPIFGECWGIGCSSAMLLCLI